MDYIDITEAKKLHKLMIILFMFMLIMLYVVLTCIRFQFMDNEISLSL